MSAIVRIFFHKIKRTRISARDLPGFLEDEGEQYADVSLGGKRNADFIQLLTLAFRHLQQLARGGLASFSAFEPVSRRSLFFVGIRLKISSSVTPKAGHSIAEAKRRSTRAHSSNRIEVLVLNPTRPFASLAPIRSL